MSLVDEILDPASEIYRDGTTMIVDPSRGLLQILDGGRVRQLFTPQQLRSAAATPVSQSAAARIADGALQKARARAPLARKHTHARTHAHSHLRTHAVTLVRTHTRTHACTHSRLNARAHAHMHACIQKAGRERGAREGEGKREGERGRARESERERESESEGQSEGQSVSVSESEWESERVSVRPDVARAQAEHLQARLESRIAAAAAAAAAAEADWLARHRHVEAAIAAHAPSLLSFARGSLWLLAPLSLLLLATVCMLFACAARSCCVCRNERTRVTYVEPRGRVLYRKPLGEG
eukprot:4334223-Pleurochrysis_carterae.AAC.2